ncbi:putative bacteriophage protein [Fructilactobacillus florum 8D]|uniref:Putative bacteriophage protein n=1 Tax=Fructilactobacillus florum 8D TaxID=1221538 RepID=W9ED15_9LACO|nr:baseplate J/gp47 family protein [Fructilactobacillus florum]ETO40013.1 putative bacteriophage protein [Fructilactobacillus florum 8D]
MKSLVSSFDVKTLEETCPFHPDTHLIQSKYGNALARGTVQAKSMEAGYAENVMPNTIIVAENVVGGFYAVTNLDSATGGSDAETDEQLRNRILVNNRHVPSETKSGIETAIKNIAGVTDSRLIANNTMQDDSYGNPPKSCHLYVIGGDDTEIATTYFNHLTPVSTTVGKISVEVLDIAKKPVEIKFDRAKTVPIYIDVVLTVDDTQFNADSAPETIKKNILSYLSLLTMGSDVLFSQLFAPAYSVSGVKNVQIKLGTSQDSMSENDISVDQFELPVSSRDLISIEVRS